MASAAWEEVKAQWLVWSLGATVAGPAEGRWLLCVASLGEGGQAGLEEEAVGCCFLGLASFEAVEFLGIGGASVEEGEWKGEGLSQADEGEEGEDDVELHSEEVVKNVGCWD